MDDRPEFGVINEEGITGGVSHQSRHDLRRFDRYLPFRKPDHADAESQQSADQQHPARTKHAEIMHPIFVAFGYGRPVTLTDTSSALPNISLTTRLASAV